MAVRRERVILDLQDDFTPGMARAAAATMLLDRNLKSLSGSAARINRPLNEAARVSDRLSTASGTASRNVDGLARSARNSESSINQLTGRLRVLADVAAIIGPSFVPIGAVAIPALTGLASQAGFAAVGLGSLVAASQGVGDALKAVNEAALEPTMANLEKASEAMGKLGPQAQAFVSRFQELRPVLADIRNASAAGWFPGLTESLTSLEQIAPEVASLFGEIGAVGGNLVAEGAAAFAGPEWADFRSFVAAEAPKALDDLGRTLGNVARGLAELWQAFGPLNRSFSSWLLDASRSFAEWADGLSATEGFQEFVDYIRENGPRVADALGAVGKAIVEIVEALAPLGGPSLKIIETFADVIGKIADSDLGTPILAGVAALALYNRTLQVTAALQTRLTGSQGVGNALAAGGLFGATRAGANRTRGSFAVLTGDLRSMSREYGKASRAQSVMLSGLSQTTAAAQRTSASLKSVGKGAALMGGLALVTTGAADSFGLANTASLALAGSIAGPWGAAIGGGIGLLVDLAKAAGDSKGAFDDAIKATTSAADLGDLATATEALRQAKKARDELMKDSDSSYDANFAQGAALASAYGQNVPDGYVKSQTEGLSPEAKKAQEDYEKAAESVANLRDELATAALAERGFTNEMIAGANAAGVSSAALLENVAAMEQRTVAANAAFSAETQWREALKAATEQAKDNNAGIRGSSDAALSNRKALEGLSAAWARQHEAMVAAGRSSEDIERKYRIARRAFIKTATDMGVPIRRARELAEALLGIPEKRAIEFSVRDQATARIKAIKSVMDTIQDKTVRITTINDPDRYVGGYTGRGGKYEPAGIVHRDEVVIPKELVRRDAPMLKQRYGHLPGMDQLYTGGLAGYASGGRVGALDFAGLPAISTAASLRELNRALADSTKALDKERSQREAITAKMSDLRSTVRGNLTSDLFAQSSAWSSGSSIGDALGIIRGDIADGRTLQSQIAQLRKKGLDGNALASLLANADSETIANFASGTRGQLQQYEAAFNQRASIAASTGRAAGVAAFGEALNQSNVQLEQLNRRVDRLTKVTQAEHRQDRKSNKRGVGDGARNIRRG